METDFIKLIETRRSIRSYKKEPVSEKDLNKILEAGTYGSYRWWKTIAYHCGCY